MKRNYFKVAALTLIVALGSNSCCTSEPSEPAVKNIIYLIGDGMGLAHVSMLLVEGEYAPTAFDASTNVALAKTYSANSRITDSAAAGTALSTGYKTNNGMLGMTPDSVWVESVATKASRAGYATGVVASCELQHATPAAFYAHAASRKFYDIISAQLAESSLDVAIGGGKEYLLQGEDVSHLDKLEQRGYSIYEDMEELESTTSNKVIGLFGDRTILSLAAGRPADYLERATKAAIKILDRNDKGFFLMVEGSQIDWEAHDNNPTGILDETRDFEKCVKAAMAFADATPGTLVIITADHETGGMAMVYPSDGTTISESSVAYDFTTGNHSGTLVPVYLYGTGAENFNGILQNTDLPTIMASLLGLE